MSDSNLSKLRRSIIVKGNGEYQERVEHFIIDVAISVRSTTEESAVQQARELGGVALDILNSPEFGLSKSEIMAGGLSAERPWSRRNKVGIEATQKLIVRTQNIGAAAKALSKVQAEIGVNKRISVEIKNRKPEFKSTEEARLQALEQAVQNARKKASRMAVALGAKLGRVLQIEEGNEGSRSSGFGDDHDWWGDNEKFFGGGFDPMLLGNMAGGAAMEPKPDIDALNAPNRTIWVKCRVQFELTDPES